MVVHRKNEKKGTFTSYQQPLVIELAKEKGWCFVGEYQEAEVLCFCRGDDRISVYPHTGTVAFCFEHPLKGKTQLFQTNMDWKTMMALFGGLKVPVTSMFCRRGSGQFGQPEPLLKRRSWIASPKLSKSFRSDGISMDTTATFALGHTWFCSDHSGRYFWGSGAPLKFDQKLRGRQPFLPHVDVVAFGPDPASFFLQFADGSQLHQDIPDTLRYALERRQDVEVKSLALGKDSSFICLWSDGSASWEGLEKDNEIALTDGHEIQDVTLGPSGEWFVAYPDGWICHGQSRECDKAICRIENQIGEDIVRIAFGAKESYHITFE